MTFQIRSIYVSHSGLPSGLATRADWENYILDIDRELAMLAERWRAYCELNGQESASPAVFANAEERLNGLRAQAVSIKDKIQRRLRSPDTAPLQTCEKGKWRTLKKSLRTCFLKHYRIGSINSNTLR